jgi:glycosyltransferase involved in cell wall biosynthesis
LERLAETLEVASRVYLRNSVDDESLFGLIQSAALFLYPSLIEGFGMPIAEALSAGVPVLASDQPWAREAGGPDSGYVRAADPAAWAEALRDLLDDAAVTARMREAGRRYAERFEPARIAARLREVYEAVGSGRPKSLSSLAP